MPVTNAYATLPELKTWVGISDANDDDNLTVALNAASRWIDTYCKRKFWLDGTATARTFQATDSYLLDVDDIGSATGFAVKVDQDADGTFETTFASTDYVLLPDDAPSAEPEARPYTQLHAVGDYTFPVPSLRSKRSALVQVTAKWGWPAVPEDVRQACLIRAHQLFTRRKSPDRVAGANDFGVVRVGSGADDDIKDLLSGYALVGVW